MILDRVYEHERLLADRVYLTQPLGGGRVADYTWAQVLDQSRRMAAHLRERNFEPGSRIAILSKNCAHFVMAELAIWMSGHTTVAIFPTETAQTVGFVLEHSGASLLFVGKLDLWDHQREGVRQDLPCIALPLTPPVPFDTWDAIIARTSPLEGQPARAPGDLAMLIYTSGSTGRPKGVMVSFAAISRVADAIARDIRQRIGVNGASRMLSYLPLAHSFERSWIEASSLADGRTQVFFAESLDTFLQDLRRARPTLFLSVPRLWLKFQEGVFAKMPAQRLDRLLRLPLVGRLVARKVLRELGLDHVVEAGSGSAPIPPELIAWYRRLGLNLHEGYGMTEDNSYSHTSNAQFHAPGHVGVPMPGVEVRLSAEGEILIKSPGQFSGYYRQPELTAESFTEDGFFRTGDLGERSPDGLLRVTGRMKELFKTAKGKYVAPAPIENELNAHPWIEQSMVSGVGRPMAFAIVVLAEHVRARIGDPAQRVLVERELQALLQQVNEHRAEHEKLRMIVVAPEPWTIENACLTPTMKIRRARIEADVADRLDDWYRAPGPVVWT
jgi:long-subunit acyl-CoA synthetase (AMP-forming)